MNIIQIDWRQVCMEVYGISEVEYEDGRRDSLYDFVETMSCNLSRKELEKFRTAVLKQMIK